MSDKNYKFCPKCGKELPKEMNYCTICGFKQPDADSSNNVEENEVHNQSSPSPEPNHHNMKTAIISLWTNMFFIGGKLIVQNFGMVI